MGGAGAAIPVVSPLSQVEERTSACSLAERPLSARRSGFPFHSFSPERWPPIPPAGPSYCQISLIVLALLVAVGVGAPRFSHRVGGAQRQMWMPCHLRGRRFSFLAM